MLLLAAAYHCSAKRRLLNSLQAFNRWGCRHPSKVRARTKPQACIAVGCRVAMHICRRRCRRARPAGHSHVVRAPAAALGGVEDVVGHAWQKHKKKTKYESQVAPQQCNFFQKPVRWWPPKMHPLVGIWAQRMRELQRSEAQGRHSPPEKSTVGMASCSAKELLSSAARTCAGGSNQNRRRGSATGSLPPPRSLPSRSTASPSYGRAAPARRAPPVTGPRRLISQAHRCRKSGPCGCRPCAGCSPRRPCPRHTSSRSR